MSTGDVLGVIGVLVGLCIASWGLTLMMQVLFPSRVEAAYNSLHNSPWGSLFTGMLLVGIPGVFGLVLLGSPFPGAKLLGSLLVVMLLAAGYVGAAGIVRTAAARLQTMDSKLSEYGASSRGAIMLFAACCLPFVGWLLVAPAVLFIGLGSTALSLVSKRSLSTAQ